MNLAACRQIEAVLVQSDAGMDAVQLASMQQHLQSCPTCRRRQRAWALVREGALAANDVLDDLTGARVFGRVQARLGAHALRDRTVERATRPRWTRLATSLAFAVVTILAFVLGTWLRKPERSLTVTPLVLEPYQLHVLTERRTVTSGKGLDHLELPPHASTRARLGRAAELTLLGPLELTVHDGDKQRVELELGRGTLLGDFDGSGGRSLRISTRDATIDIVGTRFIVEASGTGTRVAVDHGLVRVESRGRLRMVGAGLSWSTDGDALVPLDGAMARLFDRAAPEQWEGLASEPSPKGARSETSREGAPKEAKEDETTRRGQGVRRSEGPQRTVRQRRIHVSRGRSQLGGDAEGANEPAYRAGQTASQPEQASPTAGPHLLALADPTPVPARSPAVTASARLEEAAPAVVPPPPVAPLPAESSLPVPAPPAASRATVASLYKEAEEAMKRGDAATGKQRLVAVVRTFPRDVMADSARFELALLANKQGDHREALAQIRDILDHGSRGPFVEPAQFLRCRVYLEEDRDAAETCLARFVLAYPRSAHDDVAMRALIDLSRAKGHCGKAAHLAETYLQRHPKGAFAEEAARVRDHCGP